MSSEPTHRLFEVLPAEVTDGGRLPLLYATLAGTPTDDAPWVPTVVCDHHRTVGYSCQPYHKPISRCLGADR
jgi:hypothetical protein